MLNVFDGGFNWNIVQSSISRQAQAGAIQGLASVGAVAGGIAAQPGSPINNFIISAISDLVGKSNKKFKTNFVIK